MSDRTYTCKEISEKIGIPAQRLRVNMASGLWDLGTYIPSKNGGKSYYNITAEKVYKQFGISIDGYEPIKNDNDMSALINEVRELIKVLKEKSS